MHNVNRKDRRLSWFLIVCYILFIAGLSYRSAVFAEFDAISPANVLTEDLSSLDFSPSQFTRLSDVVDAKVLLQKENIRNFFDKNFSIDREYGALKNGLLVEDWAHVGAGIGLSETEVVSVYNLWRENKISELSDLRSGDSSAINNLIESSFVDPSSVDGGTVGKLKNGKTLSSASDWENFAKEKGLPAGGAALMGIYFLWRKRKDFEKAQGLARKDSLYMELETYIKNGKSYKKLQKKFYDKFRYNAKKIFKTKTSTLKVPLAPVKSSVVKQYEALAPKRGTIVAQVRKYSGTYHKIKRDIGVTKSRLAYYDSISKKYSASSTANQAQVNRWTRVSNIRSNQIKYASSRGYAFSNIIHKNRYLIKRENYQISSLVQQQSEYIKNQYYKVIKKLQSIPKVDNTPLGKEVRKWENIIKSWKSAAHGQHKQNYLNAIR